MTRLLNCVVIGVSALALASCGTVDAVKNADFVPGNNSSKLASQLGTMPGTQSPDNMDVISRAAFWGTRYDRAPNDAEVAVNYSKALRDMGSNEEALKVMTRFAETVKATPEIKLELGKVLIANDRAFEAVRPLEAATREVPQSWQAWSAYGVALDKIGQHDEAIKQYDRALALAPDKASVLNNKGLSLALNGKLSQAEYVLRQASVAPQGGAQIRQNLAIVLGFAGKTGEAERLARSDLPPRVAENNIAYFRSLVAQPAYWQEFTGDNVEMPDFGGETIAPPRAAKMTPVYEGPITVNGMAAPGAAAPAAAAPVPLQRPQPEPQEEPDLPDSDELEDVLSSLPDNAAEG